MSDLRRLAAQIYDTGNSERILCALGSLLKVSLNQGNDVREEVNLLGSQVIRRKTESEKQAS